MDETQCFGIPYPECAPPLTKDASDVEQFRDLALEVDTAVQALADRTTEYLTAPDSACMSGGLTAAGRIQDLPFSASVFDNASMVSIPDGRLRIRSAGWYIIGGWVRGTSGVAAGIGIRIQPTLNGDPFGGGRHGPGRPTFAGASATDDVAWAISTFLNVDDLLGARINHSDSAALSVTYAHRIWATRILANV